MAPTNSKSKQECASASCPPAVLNFLNVPTEIRLSIYSYVFGVDTAVLDFDRIEAGSGMMGHNYAYLLHKPRATRILQTCRTILTEARPVLFANTTFVVNKFADFHKLLWDTHCRNQPWLIKHIDRTIAAIDLEQRWNSDRLAVTKTSFPGLDVLEMHCSGPGWRADAITGVSPTYSEGRAKMLQLALGHVDGSRFDTLIEEVQGKGQIHLKLMKKHTYVKGHVSHSMLPRSSYNLTKSSQQILLAQRVDHGERLSLNVRGVALDGLNQLQNDR